MLAAVKRFPVRAVAMAIALLLMVALVIAVAAPSDAQTPADGPIVFVRDPGTGEDSEIFRLDPDGTETRLTDDAFFDWDPDVSPDGTRIVYSSERNGDGEIVVMDLTGDDPVRVTDDGATDSEPSWSPDGTRIVFTSFRGDRRGIFSDIYTMRSDGTRVRRLTDNGKIQDYNPAWSPAGNLIAFARVDSPRPERIRYQIRTMNARGGDGRRLTAGRATNGQPAWSPDGATLAFQREKNIEDYAFEIFKIDVASLAIARLTRNLGDDQTPAWSPTGARIAFQSGSSGTIGIWSMATDGSDPVELTTPPFPAYDLSPDWGPLGP